jgi:hypothetical protein
MTYRRRSRTVPWFRAHPVWGTVYLMQSLETPRLIKIGYTQRRTKDRRAELIGSVQGDLKIMFKISMPNAYATEQLILRGMRQRLFGFGDRRGTEWFWLRRWETLDHVAIRIERAANRIKLTSQIKGSWPREATVRVFDQRGALT